MKNSEMTFDKRIVTRNIYKNVLSEKEYNNFLKSLPDDASEGEPVTIEDEEKEI
jgi:hypothetical protein